MEARILGALRRCAALDGLADFGGERAIFSRSAPDDVEFAGPGYPRCVFDWREEYAPRRGRLTVWIAALDESAAMPDDMAARLAEKLDGMAFGGDRARVLRWRDTDGYEPGLEDMRAPRLSCAVVRFDAYEFRRAGEGVESALERAVGAALGAEFRTVYDAAAEGEAGDGRLYCLRLSALTSGKATAGCAWRSFEAALHLPCGDERAAQAAYAALERRGRLEGELGCALLDTVRLEPGADGCLKGQMSLSGRMNALAPETGGLALRHVELAGAGYALSIGAPGKG